MTTITEAKEAAASGRSEATMPDTFINTDDAAPDVVLAEVLRCALGWVPEARIVGNVRAGDIVRALTPPPAPEGEREALAATILDATDSDGDQLYFAGHFYTRQQGAGLLAAALLAAGYRRA